MIEGASQAYCSRCKEHGHYVTLHLTKMPIRWPRPWETPPWWLRLHR